MISVIIPAHNAACYIPHTLSSIRSQGVNLEIILVDDGSTDDTAKVAIANHDDLITVITQSNLGVSAARNKGLQMAKGDYIVFFDADDYMPPGFLQDRLIQLELHPEWIYVCGPVKSFPVEGPVVRGIGPNSQKIILCYDQGYSSCPSNYLLRRNHLLRHGIHFNEKLSSTADRLFLLQLGSTGEGGYADVTPLAYRISSESMSHKLNEKLIFDNLAFYKLVSLVFKESPYIREFNFKASVILGLSFVKLKRFGLALKYIAVAFFISPSQFLAHCCSWLTKERSHIVPMSN